MSNGSSYRYYLTAVYSEGVSEPCPEVVANPSELSFAVLGTGTTVTAGNTLSPINNTYKSIHGQSVYTVAELNAAGIYGPVNISQLGFYTVGAPSLALANFTIRIKHTTATSAAAWVDGTGLQTVYSSAAYMPVPGTFDMLSFSSPFLWNGTQNIVIDTAFGMNTGFSQSGTMQTTAVANGYIRVGSDTANQTNVFSGGAVRAWRPNLKLGLSAVPLAIPQLSGITKTAQGTRLSWTAVPGATGYKIFRANLPNGAFSLVSTASGLEFTDPEILPRAFYYIKAVSAIRVK